MILPDTGKIGAAMTANNTKIFNFMGPNPFCNFNKPFLPEKTALADNIFKFLKIIIAAPPGGML